MRTTLRMAAAGALVVVPLTMLGASAAFASATPVHTNLTHTDPACRPGHDYGCDRGSYPVTTPPTTPPTLSSSTSPTTASPTTAPPTTAPATRQSHLPETGTSASALAVAGAALVGTGAALGLGALAFARRRRFEA